ncbi:MAG: aldehyde dehydrogenase family protein [Gammaproteobacteria bacterium]
MLDDFKLLINGKLVEGDGVMDVINPATEGVVASCPRGSEKQIDLAVRSAKAALPTWSSTKIENRRSILNTIAEAIEKNANEMASLLTAEQGKPLNDALGEVNGTAAFFRHAAGLEFEPKVIESSGKRQIELHRRPIGVVAAIIPWNFPLMIMAFKVPLALLVGNTVVVKPAATTPLVTLMFAQIIADIVPAGVINVVTDANDLGDFLTSHPDVAKISFTGSTATGQKVMTSAAKSMKRFGLELGGNDPAIVLDDADPSAIAQGVFNGSFFNTGQVCLAIKRLYVHESKYDEMCEELSKLANETIIGDGAEESSSLGPLQNEVQYEKVKMYLDDARANGRIISGGEVPDRLGYFIQPTIVTDMAEGTKLVDEEQFGPILPILKYTDLDDVIRRANDTEYGLGASVWSSDRDRAKKVALQLEAGTVWINQHIDIAPHVPQAGAKNSGIGVEISDEGLLEYTQVQVVNEAL